MHNKYEKFWGAYGQFNWVMKLPIIFTYETIIYHLRIT